MITNPIVPGFNPDTSVIGGCDQYAVAARTFGWFAAPARSRAAASHPAAESAA
jgi:beta-xylosidase